MIALGTPVYGREGKLGELTRLVIDRQDDVVSALVIKHGTLAPVERVVPIGEIVDREDGTAYVDATAESFEAYGPFDPKGYHGPDPDYTGPPGWDAQSMGMENFQYLAAVAFAPASFGSTVRPLGFPGGETLKPAPGLASISKGSDVIDLNGDSVGKVAELAADEATGEPVRLVVREGRLFRHEHIVPLTWVEAVRDDVVVLNHTKDDVERLAG